jgi:hypothetical protein
MPRGFAGEDEAGRANDPSGPGAGGGDRSEDRDNRQSHVDRAADRAAERAAVEAAINQARSTGRTVGVFTADDYKDGVFQDNQGILGLIGYDQKKSFFDNVLDITVPGRNTPLGGLTAVVPGLTEAQQIALGLVNSILGKQMNQGKAPTETAVSDSVIGKDSIVGELANMPQTGIASGRQTPATGYTGRPDDAPAPSQAPAGSPQQQAIDAINDMINDQQSNLSTSQNVGIASGKPTTSVGPSAFGVKARQVGTLENMQRGFKQLADNIVSIPGGYMDTKTGLTYAGDYQKNPSAKTVTGKYTQGVQPFSLEALQQNVKNMFGG